MPKVTVLMAVYNGEHYIREAIESILDQTFRDFEFLIINDGSIDSTQTIIHSYNDPRIRLINNEYNLGLFISLNRGLILAKGQFIARQDADDISEPERLAKQVAFLEEHTEMALLGTWYKEIDPQGNLIEYRKLPFDYIQIRWSLMFYCPFVHSSVMLRSSALRQIGLYDETLSYSGDYELWCRIAHHLPITNLNQYLVRWRTNPWSMTATYGDRSQEGHRIRIGKMSHLLGWDTVDIAINESRFNNMVSFLLDSKSGFNLQEINWIVEELIRLHTVFCQNYQICPTDCRSHRAILFMDIARAYINNDCYSEAQQFLTQAFYLHWPILFTKQYLWLIYRLIKNYIPFIQ